MPMEIPTLQDIEAVIRRTVEPLRFEIERLRTERSGGPVPIPEAARRLGVTARAVQRWIKAGQLQVVPIGGRRLVILPDASGNR